MLADVEGKIRAPQWHVIGRYELGEFSLYVRTQRCKGKLTPLPFRPAHRIERAQATRVHAKSDRAIFRHCAVDRPLMHDHRSPARGAPGHGVALEARFTQS